MTHRLFLMTAIALAALATPAQPQRAQGGGRDALEQRVRERMAQVVKQRLDLTDAQMEKLGATNRRFEEQRRGLVAQERDIRIGVREEVLAGDKANQDRVARLLEQMLKVQRERLSLVEQEQRELASFLTPVQRAKYLAVQDQIRRRMDEMRENREGKQGGAGRSRKGPARSRPPGSRPPF